MKFKLQKGDQVRFTEEGKNEVSENFKLTGDLNILAPTLNCKEIYFKRYASKPNSLLAHFVFNGLTLKLPLSWFKHINSTNHPHTDIFK